jgi:two-component system phosphate regulon sensor histidine kinase PhoR
MVEGVLVLDSQGRVALANPRLLDLFGLHGRIEGRHPLEVIRSAPVQDVLREALASDESVPRTLEFEGADGRVLRLHAVGFPLGDGRAAVGVFHDVTEIRRLEAVRRDFVANASHELRTPLTAIRGFAETLLASRLPHEEARSYLEIILNHTERLSRLVDDLLALSRIEGGKLPLELGAVDVASISAALLRDMAPLFSSKSLDARLVAEPVPRAWANREALEQVLQNLLDNAAQYTDPGGKIEVRISSNRGVLRVRVSDTGIGIPEHEQSRVFERFYRVDKGRSRAAGGTGLGLAIAKHLVQAMGGTIALESQVGHGSTFSFTLPAAAPAG